MIALKDIPANVNVVAIPDRAFITAFATANTTLIRKHAFGTAVLERAGVTTSNLGKWFNVKEGNTFVRGQHIALALHLAHAILADDPEVEPLVVYTDQLPRAEGDFTHLFKILEAVVDQASPMWATARQELAMLHTISQSEMRCLLCYCLAMVMSRSVPITQEDIVAKLALGTDLGAGLMAQRKRKLLAAPASASAAESLDDGSAHANDGGGSAVATAPQVAVLAPVLDMINHADPSRANVMLAIPHVEGKSAAPLLDEAALAKQLTCMMVRSLAPISKGEELLMTYGDGSMDQRAVQLIYGFDPSRS